MKFDNFSPVENSKNIGINVIEIILKATINEINKVLLDIVFLVR